MIPIDPTGATIAFIFLVFFAVFGGYLIIKHIDEIDHNDQTKDSKKKTLNS